MATQADACIVPFTTNFDPPPFSQCPQYTNDPQKMTDFLNDVKTMWEWMFKKFSPDATDPNTFSHFIQEVNSAIASLDTALVNRPILNFLINPQFNIWQRGLSVIGTPIGAYGADCWKIFDSKSTAVFSYDAEASKVTSNSTYGAADFLEIVQPIEQIHSPYTQYSAMNLNVIVDASATMKIALVVIVDSGGSLYSYFEEFDLTGGTQGLHMSMPSCPVNSSKQPNEVGVTVKIVLNEGRGGQQGGVAKSWQNNLRYTTSGLSDFSTGQSVRLNSCMFATGKCPTPFQNTDKSVELHKCKRYFQKLNINRRLLIVYPSTGQTTGGTFDFYPHMIKAPVVTLDTNIFHYLTATGSLGEQTAGDVSGISAIATKELGLIWFTAPTPEIAGLGDIVHLGNDRNIVASCEAGL